MNCAECDAPLAEGDERDLCNECTEELELEEGIYEEELHEQYKSGALD